MIPSKIIGIVGGVGPAAGLDLNRKIINETIATNDQDHLSVYLISDSSHISDRTAYLKGKISTNPADGIVKVIGQLAEMGADVIGIPCNTSHASEIWDPISKSTTAYHPNIKLLHMIEETGRYLDENFPDKKNIGILGTSGTVQSGLYTQLKKTGQFVLLYPDPKIQEEKVHPSIYNPEFGVKSISNPIQDRAKEFLLEAAQHLIIKGAEVIVLGCTEIPLAIQQRELDGIHLIDPTLVLARALIREANPDKLKQFTKHD